MTDNNEETLLEFPCHISIKAMGKNHIDLEAKVLEIVRKHAPNIGEGAVKTRPSKGGKYISVTVSIQAESKAQLDAIYMDLTACEQVLMAL